jgi:parvulin-like peptidyl-prolyl isomerase
VLSAKFDTLVEKRDLAELRQELLREIASLRQEMESANAELRKDMEALLRKDMEASIASLRQENAALRKEMEASDAALRQEMENEFAIRKEMQLLEQRLIIKLGAMLVVATGVVKLL